MQLKPQLIPQEGAYAGQRELKLRSVSGEQYEIVRVSRVRSRPQSVLHELVELVHTPLDLTQATGIFASYSQKEADRLTGRNYDKQGRI